MLMPKSCAFVLATSFLATLAQAQEDGKDRFWPHWRGPLATGVAPHADPPIEWSETKNIRWKVEIPGKGHGTPVIWGDRVFVTTAIPVGEQVEPVPDDAPGAHDNASVTRKQRYIAMALSRKDGEILWQRTLREQLPHAGGHVSGSLASASPVTDGERLYVYFGSQGLYCLDLDGVVLWEKDLGDMSVKHGHGEGSSPVLHGDKLVINWDHEEQSFVAALDKHTGEERWRTERNEVTSWSSPIVVEHDGRHQVIVNGTRRLQGYDLETGEAIWECSGLSHNIVASPVAGDGMVFAGSSYEKRAFLAIVLEGAKGDITGTANVAWFHRRGTPYVPSPLLYGEWLYFLSHYQNVLSRVRAKTGKLPQGPFRLGGLFDIYASPVGAAGRIYVTDRAGMTLVMAHGGEDPELLATNQLDDSFCASAALVEKELYLRGARYLYCIAADE